MIKKLLLLAIPIAAIAIISAQAVNADYYDCQGILREGQPGPSECRQLRVPPSNDIQDEPESTYRPPRITRVCGDVPCDSIQNNEPERIEPNTYEDADEDDLDIRKVRKYCVRDYCYIIYEICDSSGHCEEEAKRVKRDEIDWNNYDRNDCSRCNNWRDWVRYNTYRYYYRNYHTDYRNYDFVYRGTRYGRYHNRYWDF